MERIAGEELRKPSEWLNQHLLFEFENGTATVRRVSTPDKWSMDCKDVQKYRTDEKIIFTWSFWSPLLRTTKFAFLERHSLNWRKRNSNLWLPNNFLYPVIKCGTTKTPRHWIRALLITKQKLQRTYQFNRDGIKEKHRQEKKKIAGKVVGNKMSWKAKRNNECPSAPSLCWPEKHATVFEFQHSLSCHKTDIILN